METSVDSLAALIKEGSDALQGQTQASVTSLTSSVDQLLEKLVSQQAQANAEADNRVAQIGGAFERPVNALTATVERFEAISTATQRGVEQLQTILDGLQTAAASMNALAAPINEAAGRFERSGQQVATISARIEEASGSLNQSIDAIRESNQQTRDAWADYGQRFEGIDESLARAFQGVTDGLQRYTEQVNTFIEELDRHTADIAGKLGAATQDLSEQIEELVDAVSRLERSAQGRAAVGTPGRR